jgi:hypothetical protein
MTETAPDPAVQIAEEELGRDPYYCIRDVCDVLHARRWLHDPKRVAALEAVAAAAVALDDALTEEKADWVAEFSYPEARSALDALLRVVAECPALDAAQAGTAAEEDAPPARWEDSGKDWGDGATVNVTGRLRIDGAGPVSSDPYLHVDGGRIYEVDPAAGTAREVDRAPGTAAEGESGAGT